MYAHIIKFLLRALDWFEEGKIAHAIHSITHPAALQYQDLLEGIQQTSRSIANSAITSSQAEQRDMHNELRSLTNLVKRLNDDVQSIWASMLESRRALSEVQLTQALTLVSSACSVDHKSNFQTSLFIRNKHRLKSKNSICPAFWMSPDLQAWDTSRQSSSINLQAPFKTRLYCRDFCTNVIEQLRQSHITVIWILKPRDQKYYPAIEVLKSLIYQALIVDEASHLDLAMSFQLRKFLDAHSLADYVAFLGSVLEHFKLVYIIVEAGAMYPVDAVQCKQSLLELSRRLSERDASTIVKIMTMNYFPGSLSSSPKEDILVRFKKASRRKSKKMPVEPLQSVASGRSQLFRRGHQAAALPFRRRAPTMGLAAG